MEKKLATTLLLDTQNIAALSPGWNAADAAFYKADCLLKINVDSKTTSQIGDFLAVVPHPEKETVLVAFYNVANRIEKTSGRPGGVWCAGFVLSLKEYADLDHNLLALREEADKVFQCWEAKEPPLTLQEKDRIKYQGKPLEGLLPVVALNSTTGSGNAPRRGNPGVDSLDKAFLECAVWLLTDILSEPVRSRRRIAITGISDADVRISLAGYLLEKLDKTLRPKVSLTTYAAPSLGQVPESNLQLVMVPNREPQAIWNQSGQTVLEVLDLSGVRMIAEKLQHGRERSQPGKLPEGADRPVPQLPQPPRNEVPAVMTALPGESPSFAGMSMKDALERFSLSKDLEAFAAYCKGQDVRELLRETKQNRDLRKVVLKEQFYQVFLAFDLLDTEDRQYLLKIALEQETAQRLVQAYVDGNTAWLKPTLLWADEYTSTLILLRKLAPALGEIFDPSTLRTNVWEFEKQLASMQLLLTLENAAKPLNEIVCLKAVRLAVRMCAYIWFGSEEKADGRIQR